MTAHILDRPIWAALTGPQAKFGAGSAQARRFAPDVSPFAATCEEGERAAEALGAILPAEGVMVLLQADLISPPVGAVEVSRAEGVQMLLDEGATLHSPEIEILQLTETEAPEMLALATLTEPGPFLARTHTLGRFWGVRIGGRLAAMAGERLRAPGHVEVSGVCTHPDFRGRRLAAALSTQVAMAIRADGAIPFLHAYATNTTAIQLYEKLGFRVRTRVNVGVFRRAA